MYFPLHFKLGPAKESKNQCPLIKVQVFCTYTVHKKVGSHTHLCRGLDSLDRDSVVQKGPECTLLQTINERAASSA